MITKKLIYVSLATIGLLSSQLPAVAGEEARGLDAENAETRAQPFDVNLALDSGELRGEQAGEFTVAEASEWNVDAYEESANIQTATPRGGKPGPRGGHSSTYGNTRYYSAGGHSSTYGNTQYYSGGGHSSTYGNTEYYSNGGHASSYGNTTYYSNGGHASTYGNTTYFSNGGHCSTYGSTEYCS